MKFDYITQFLINALKSVIQRMNERENDVQQIVRTDRTKLQSPSSIYPPVSRFREGYRRRTYRETLTRKGRHRGIFERRT